MPPSEEGGGPSLDDGGGRDKYANDPTLLEIPLRYFTRNIVAIFRTLNKKVYANKNQPQAVYHRGEAAYITNAKRCISSAAGCISPTRSVASKNGVQKAEQRSSRTLNSSLRFTEGGREGGPYLQIQNYMDIGKDSVWAQNYLFMPAGRRNLYRKPRAQRARGGDRARCFPTFGKHRLCPKFRSKASEF